ncbi:MAG: polysaccharide biosynthesis C-terminal domain-containing protein, partial [Ignavibacteriaceae bacterium]
RTLNIKAIPGKIRKGVLKKVLSSSLPIGIGISFVFVYDKIDVLLIEKIISPEAVAFYAVAYSIYKLPQIIVSVLLVPLFSDFSRILRNEDAFSFKLLIKPGAAILIFSASMIIGINLTSELLLNFIYGLKYLDSAWILNMLCFALPGLFLNGLTGITLNSLRKEKPVMYSGFSAMVLNIVINLILLDKIGIKGAVIATIITEYANFIIQLFILAKIRMFPVISRQI